MTDINRDDHVLAAMRHPARIRMEVWSRALEEHRRHPSFRTQQWAFSREWGFTCECAGYDQEWRINISSLRELLPETRMVLQRFFLHQSQRGNKAAKRLTRRANARAKTLLHKHLTKPQRWELRASKAFTVTGEDGRTYHVTEGTAGNVYLLEDGIPTYRFCIVPDHTLTSLPVYDLMLAQKVLLESNIRMFLGTACTTNMRTQMVLRDGAVLLDGQPEVPIGPIAGWPAIDEANINEEDIDEPEHWVRARLQAAIRGDEDGSADTAWRDEGHEDFAEPAAAE